MFVDLSGRVYARELMDKASVTASAYMYWKNLDEITRINSIRFISEKDIEDKDERYKKAFMKCFDWSQRVPIIYFCNKVNMSVNSFYKSKKIKKMLEPVPVKGLLSVRIPDELYKASLEGYQIFYLSFYPKKEETELFDDIIVINGANFGVYK